MNPYDSLKTSLYNSLKTFLPSNEVIHSHQGGQEPKGSYCAINILRSDRVGKEYDATYANDTNGVMTITSRNEYEATVRLLFVGKQAGDLAYELEASILNDASRFAFGTNSLSIMRVGEIRRVPEKRGTTFVDVFNLDVIFSYAVENTQNIEIIESVKIDTGFVFTKDADSFESVELDLTTDPSLTINFIEDYTIIQSERRIIIP